MSSSNEHEIHFSRAKLIFNRFKQSDSNDDDENVPFYLSLKMGMHSSRSQMYVIRKNDAAGGIPYTKHLHCRFNLNSFLP